MAKQYFPPDDWLLVEDTYAPEQNTLNETAFALGNGYMGVRGTPEEGFTGQSHPGTFLPLIYEAGTIRYDWQRANFPTRSTGMLTSPSWVDIRLTVGDQLFDPQQGRLHAYRRVLNLREGTLTRRVVWEDANGRQTEIESVRIVCHGSPHLGAIRYTVRPLNYSGPLVLESGINATMTSLQDAGGETAGRDGVVLCSDTVQTGFRVAMAARHRLTIDNQPAEATVTTGQRTGYIARQFRVDARQGTAYTLEKYAGVCTSRDLQDGDPAERAVTHATRARVKGFDELLTRHIAAWERFWQEQDVIIEGDPNAQQGIRFSLFNLAWNYAGDDPRLNIGAKGISGPGYGGLYFWDSEVYLLPYYTYTEPEKARNLLLQRWHTLPQAKERAARYGYRGAWYPWTTLDGHNCAIPWEYSMLEQHVSAAIPYGVWLYQQSTDDEAFLQHYGAEMVFETARFWASRAVFNARRGRYCINAVTGPDEYGMVVNNNCYTNAMAKFVLEYALEIAAAMPDTAPQAWATLVEKLGFDPTETALWHDVAERMYIPFDKKLGLHPQDDAFLDLDPIDVQAIPESEKPLLAHWPWERIIRHQVLKQPDVLLLMFLRSDQYPLAVKRTNYDFYEPKTTHDSSLSPCIHSIIAAEVGHEAQAFDYYLRSARLDLDDVNGNAGDGVHIAGMAGSWMCIVNGFAGMRLRKGRLAFAPHLPAQWTRVAFTLRYRGRDIRVEMEGQRISFTLKGRPLTITVHGRRVRLASTAPTVVSTAPLVTV